MSIWFQHFGISAKEGYSRFRRASSCLTTSSKLPARTGDSTAGADVTRGSVAPEVDAAGASWVSGVAGVLLKNMVTVEDEAGEIRRPSERDRARMIAVFPTGPPLSTPWSRRPPYLSHPLEGVGYLKSKPVPSNTRSHNVDGGGAPPAPRRAHSALVNRGGECGTGQL